MGQNFEMMPDGSLRASLWDELVYSGHRRAAAGLLHDVFEHYNQVEGAEGLGVQLKEDLMHMLDDNDGSKFREWQQLLQTGPAGFASKAGEWATFCCETSE